PLINRGAHRVSGAMPTAWRGHACPTMPTPSRGHGTRCLSPGRPSEVDVHDLPVVPPGQCQHLLRVGRVADEGDRPVAEAEEGAAGVPAAERLRAGAVDAEVPGVQPPEDIADPDDPGRAAVHPGPDGGPLAGRLVEGALAQGHRVRGAVLDVRVADVAVLE